MCACSKRQRRPRLKDQLVVYYECLNKHEILEESLKSEFSKEGITLKRITKSRHYPLLKIKFFENEDTYAEESKNIQRETDKLDFREILIWVLNDVKPDHDHFEGKVIHLVFYGPKIPWRENETSIRSIMKLIDDKARSIAIAFDEDEPDQLLKKAREFVQDQLGIRLDDVKSSCKEDKNSPLLVFCLNDTQLQEDIENAKLKTRDGKNVMLIVVTEQDHRQLKDTKATSGFSRKILLKWNSSQNKFQESEHTESIAWLRKFLQINEVKTTSKISRRSSFRRSFRGKVRKQITGFYVRLSNVTEEMEKKCVLYIDEKLNVNLQRTSYYMKPVPLVLISYAEDIDGESISKLAMERNRKDLPKLIVVILCCDYHNIIKLEDIDVQRIDISEKGYPQILSTRETKRSLNAVKKVLNVRTPYSEQRSGEPMKNQDLSKMNADFRRKSLPKRTQASTHFSKGHGAAQRRIFKYKQDSIITDTPAGKYRKIPSIENEMSGKHVPPCYQAEELSNESEHPHSYSCKSRHLSSDPSEYHLPSERTRESLSSESKEFNNKHLKPQRKDLHDTRELNQSYKETVNHSYEETVNQLYEETQL